MLVTVVDDHRFRAMGTDCHVLAVDAPAGAVEAVQAQVRADEDRWSRFLPASELRRLAPGRTHRLTPETAELVALALDWQRRTGGRFDPRLGRHLRRLGYDRSFERVGGAPSTATDPPHADLTLDGDRLTVPAGVELDLGGIAKGHGADRAVALARALGAAGACVNLGGDLRCAGDSPTGDGWWLALDHGDGAEASSLALGLAHGAVATSTTDRRRWTSADGTEHHHLLDPRTGRPARTRCRAASVVAATAAAAEVLAKVVLLADPRAAARLLDQHGAAALATGHDGRLHRRGDLPLHLVPAADLPEHP